MHFVIFGLTVSSSWGNGHATLWRGMLQALSSRGHTVTFYERDLPFYASTRDTWTEPKGIRLRLFENFGAIRHEIFHELSHTDTAIVTSYCPDGVEASRCILDAQHPLAVFYDLDTPVTLDALTTNRDVPYLPPDGLGDFDLVLSYTGGRALDELQHRLNARHVAPLYGWVDPSLHYPAHPAAEFSSTLSYLGTFAADRQPALEQFFVEPARSLPNERFLLGGAQYPHDFPWSTNIHFMRHLDPHQHRTFFCSGRATLNVTRRAMSVYGYCPSGRLFEAAACGVPILSDTWEGLDQFFCLDTEILPIHSSADVLNALSLSSTELKRIGEAAYERVLREHTATARAVALEHLLEQAQASQNNYAWSA